MGSAADKLCFSLVGDESRELVARSWQRLLETGSISDLELVQLKKDGTKINTVVSANRLDGANGKPPVILAMVSDITERKRAVENEERFATLLNHNPSLIFLKDEEGKYVYVNPAYEKQYALTPDWLGKPDAIRRAGTS